MSAHDDGGPAFPTPRYERGEMYSLGMTLRDYFAAQAITGIMGSRAYVDGEWDTNIMAEQAYEIADAMLEARKK